MPKLSIQELEEFKNNDYENKKFIKKSRLFKKEKQKKLKSFNNKDYD
jgi:hypothetical protein